MAKLEATILEGHTTHNSRRYVKVKIILFSSGAKIEERRDN